MPFSLHVFLPSPLIYRFDFQLESKRGEIPKEEERKKKHCHDMEELKVSWEVMVVEGSGDRKDIKQTHCWLADWNMSKCCKACNQTWYAANELGFIQSQSNNKESHSALSVLCGGLRRQDSLSLDTTGCPLNDTIHTHPCKPSKPIVLCLFPSFRGICVPAAVDVASMWETFSSPSKSSPD